MTELSVIIGTGININANDEVESVSCKMKMQLVAPQGTKNSRCSRNNI